MRRSTFRRAKICFAKLQKLITLSAKQWSFNGFLSKEPDAPRRNRAPRFLVGGDSAGGGGARRIRRLRDGPSLRRQAVFLWPVPFAVLFPADRSRPPLVAALAGAPDPGRPARLPSHLLLLPQGVLPRLFPRSSGLRGGRGRQAQLQGRDGLSLPPAERPPLLSVPRGAVSHLSLAR